MIGFFDTHPYSEYINDEDDDQTVVYFKSQVRCPGKLRIIGKVIKIEGRSKRPGSDQKVVEYQILADEYKCL